MLKKIKFLLVFAFLFILSPTVAKASEGLVTNTVGSGNITATLSTTNGLINKTSKIIKNPDIDFNYTIDIKDLASTAMLYNVKNIASTFNSKFDFNDDGIIDIYDLVLQSKHLGSKLNTPSLNLETYVGDTFNMPSSLEVQISDGYLTNIKSSWTSTSVNTSAALSFSKAGKLTDYNKIITAQVNVTNRTQNFNSINFGLITSYNNKFYYSNPANNFYLSRCNLDGSYVVKICNDEAHYINVISDWIYYVNVSDSNEIYKIKIDGTGRTKVVSDKAEYMTVSDGWIYYSNGSDYYTIYKVKIDGSQKTKLNDLTSLYLYLYGNEIYFCDYSTYADDTVYGNLCSINKDGTGYQNIAYTKMGPNVRIGNGVFFINEYNRLQYTKLDEPESPYDINVLSNNYTSINFDGKYLYVLEDDNIWKYDPSVWAIIDSQNGIGGDMLNICTDNLFVCNEGTPTHMTQVSLNTMSTKIFGIDSIVNKLYDSTDKVYQYDNYPYPNKVIADRLDGTVFPVDISWDDRNLNTDKLGNYNLSGTVQGYPSKALLTVNVVDRGNSNQNQYNYGAFAQKGEWSYFTSPYDNKLYKVKNDGSGRVKLSDDYAYYINVIGDFIYYINGNDDYIYKINSDGTSRTKIYPQNHYNKISTDGNKIFLQRYDGIYSIDMDGTNPKKVIEANNNSTISSMALVGNYIVYSSKGIYAASLDGSFKECLVPLSDDAYLLTDGRYLFWQMRQSNIVNRLDLETGEKKELDIDPYGLRTVLNNKLYYGKADGTYECNVDGLNPKRILDTKGRPMYSTKTGLYIEDEQAKKLYSCGYDGENFIEFGEETQLNYAAPQLVNVIQGSTYSLPKMVMGTMIDGSIKEIPVIWNNNTVDTSALGNYKYEGSLAGYSDKVTLDLIVSSSGVYGNGTENRSDNCMAAKYGDWIIYSNESDGSSLYKMKSDGTSKTKLSNNQSSDIYIYGDWIYYKSTDGIRRIKVDGTYETMIIRGYINLVTIKNGWIYYQDYDKLFKARIDGCENTVIVNNVTVNNFGGSITDGTAIYYESTMDNKFYKVNFDGTNNTLVSNLRVWDYNLNGDYIYFSGDYSVTNYNGWAVLKMKKDGTGLTKIMDNGSDALLVRNNYIYSISPGGGLYRSNIDGTGNTMIASFYTNNIDIIDNWIYYNMNNLNYRVKLDGTGQETF